MPDLTGTLKKVTLDGTTFDVFADTNITEIGSLYENEGIPTSGRNMIKKTRRVTNREGVTLVANGTEFEVLKELSERAEDFSMSYETAAGDVYRAQGTINMENRETEESRCTIIMIPRSDWESFISS